MSSLELIAWDWGGPYKINLGSSERVGRGAPPDLPGLGIVDEVLDPKIRKGTVETLVKHYNGCTCKLLSPSPTSPSRGRGERVEARLLGRHVVGEVSAWGGEKGLLVLWTLSI